MTTVSYSRRISENPNDILLSVEFNTENSAWPYSVEGGNEDNAPRFKSFDEAREALDAMIDSINAE